ncbi:MAG: ester cyclase [Kofleriaceae bacterium]
MTNKQLVTAFYDQINAGTTPKFPFSAAIDELRTAFPDIHYTLTHVLAEGEHVGVRWSWTGTHRGAFKGFAASQAHVTNTGMAIFTFANGAIVDVVVETDRLGFLQAIGADRAIDISKAPKGVYLIDTFTIPAASRADFEAATKKNRDFIRSLPGFRGDAMFTKSQGEAWDVATIAAWDSPQAIADAKDKVAAYYKQIGFDPAAAMKKWGVTMQRMICTASA